VQSVSSGKSLGCSRNFRPVCGSPVFGEKVDEDESCTIYAGSLDEPSGFRQTIAIFTASCPERVVIPPGPTVFDRMPPQNN
jgi:hypothetical protein